MLFYTMIPKAIWRSPFAIGLLPGDAPSEQVHCETCGRHWNKLLLSTPGVEVGAVLYGTRIPDATLLYSLVMVRTQVLRDLLANGITGIEVRPVRMLSRSQLSKHEPAGLREREYRIDLLMDNPPDYGMLYPVAGAKLHPASQVYLYGQCSACGYVEYRTRGFEYVNPLIPSYLDASSWNGSDVFRVKELGYEVICTERFVETWERRKYSGLDFRPVGSID